MISFIINLSYHEFSSITELGHDMIQLSYYASYPDYQADP